MDRRGKAAIRLAGAGQPCASHRHAGPSPERSSRSTSSPLMPCPRSWGEPREGERRGRRLEAPAGVEPASAVLQTAARPSGPGALGAPALPRRAMSSPGIEPGLRPSQSRVRVRHTPRTSIETRPLASPPPGNRTRPCGFEGRRASATPAGKKPSALARSRTWSSTFGKSRAVRHTPRAQSKPTAGLEPA